MTMATVRPRARSDTRREQARYDCRVIRELAPGQGELGRSLGLLAANTSNYVHYRNPGNLHMTLIMLSPLLRRILVPDRRGDIPRAEVQRFETRLKDSLEHTRFADYDVPLDVEHPLWLYGKNKNWLGLQLSREDYRPVGDRAMVETHIRTNYDKPGGDPVSQRYIEQNSLPLKAHVTVGEVRYDQMDREQIEALQKDPTQFLVRESYDRMEACERQYCSSCGFEEIVLPEEVGFGGLRVFCEKRQ